jgi:hypothetical protein
MLSSTWWRRKVRAVVVLVVKFILMSEDERISLIVFSHLSEQTHKIVDTQTLFPLAVIKSGVDGLLLRSLQSVDCFVYGTFDDQSCHVSFFLLADSENPAECLLLDL